MNFEELVENETYRLSNVELTEKVGTEYPDHKIVKFYETGVILQSDEGHIAIIEGDKTFEYETINADAVVRGIDEGIITKGDYVPHLRDHLNENLMVIIAGIAAGGALLHLAMKIRDFLKDREFNNFIQTHYPELGKDLKSLERKAKLINDVRSFSMVEREAANFEKKLSSLIQIAGRDSELKYPRYVIKKVEDIITQLNTDIDNIQDRVADKNY